VGPFGRDRGSFELLGEVFASLAKCRITEAANTQAALEAMSRNLQNRTVTAKAVPTQLANTMVQSPWNNP
jgi:hypothetical protein